MCRSMFLFCLLRHLWNIISVRIISQTSHLRWSNRRQRWGLLLDLYLISTHINCCWVLGSHDEQTSKAFGVAYELRSYECVWRFFNVRFNSADTSWALAFYFCNAIANSVISCQVKRKKSNWRYVKAMCREETLWTIKDIPCGACVCLSVQYMMLQLKR